MTPSTEPTKDSIAGYQTVQIHYINERISSGFSRYTHSALRSEIYREKTQEAIDFLTATNPVVSHYPFISIEVDLTGQSGHNAAIAILAKRKQWLSHLAQTERIRRQFTTQVRLCETVDAIDLLVHNTEQQLKSLTQHAPDVFSVEL